MRNIFMVVVLAGIFSACANVSRFEKGALVAYGEHLNNAPEVLYYLIRIQSDRMVDVHTTGIFLKLAPDATPLLLSELRPESVAKHLPRVVPPQQWPEHWKRQAMEMEDYSGGGFHITFKNGQLVYFGVCSHCFGGREHPIIGTPDGDEFYALPLTEKQLENIVGPPGRVYKVNEVRY